MQLAQQRHKLPGIVSYYLAEQLTSASLMASFLKGEERIQLFIEGSGAINYLYAEALQTGEVRGYAHYNKDIANTTNGDFLELLGPSILRVTKILYNKSEPVTGIVELEHGNLADDVSNYYLMSEQIPTALVLDVGLDDQGLITYSGGIIIQALPGAEIEDIKIVYDKLKEIHSLERYFKAEFSTEEILSDILPFEFQKIAGTLVDFFCRCSKEKFMAKLLLLGMDEILKMREDNHHEMVCHYCNEHYHLTETDFDRLIDESLAKQN